jgi:translation initiation factor 2 gamma subunit (eIF-2gamma)
VLISNVQLAYFNKFFESKRLIIGKIINKRFYIKIKCTFAPIKITDGAIRNIAIIAHVDHGKTTG